MEHTITRVPGAKICMTNQGIKRIPLTNADDSGGHWVTTDDGGHLFITEGGEVKTGPSGKTIETKGSEGGGADHPDKETPPQKEAGSPRSVPGDAVPTTVERKESKAKKYYEKFAGKEGKESFGAIVVDDKDQWLVEKFDKTIDVGTAEKPDRTQTIHDSVPGVIVGSAIRETDKAILISGRPLFDEESFRQKWGESKYFKEKGEPAIARIKEATSKGSSRVKEWVPKSRIVSRYGLTPPPGGK